MGQMKINEILIGEFAAYLAKDLGALLHIYNTREENERDAVDYVFDLNNNDDAIVLLQSGLTLSQLAALLSRGKHLVRYGTNYPIPTIVDEEWLHKSLKGMASELAEYAFRNVTFDKRFEQYVKDFIQSLFNDHESV